MAGRDGFAMFRDWKRQLLSARGLPGPDRRALYLYRLSEDDFGELENLLRTWLGRLLGRFSLAELTKLSGFSSLFVLYAAEWWRRRFDGSHWSWEPILRGIGANPEEWNQAQRSEFVRVGLQDWGLKPREYGALRFLGTVALQGGLPLRLLAEARGGIGQLLGQVLRQAGNGAVSQTDVLTWVQSLHRLLPKSYRQDAIFVLLADVVWTVLSLRDEAGLKSGVDALARLDERVPGWRDRFPLPVEDAHARGLMEQLIRDAAEARIERATRDLPLLRRIVPSGPDLWVLESGLTLPDTLESAQLAALMGIGTDELPRIADLSLRAGGTQRTTAVRRLSGHDKYRIERKPWGASGDGAAREHFLLLSGADGQSWTVSASRGEALDDELPWTFASDEGGFRLVRQGGGKVAPVDALVAVPPGWEMRTPAGASACPAGRLIEPERDVFRIRGVVEVRSNGDLSCTIRTGEASAREESYEWKGERLWLDFLSPSMAFRGWPQLFVAREDGSTTKTEGTPGWTPTAAFGPVLGRYPATGNLLHRARLIVLPPDARLTIEPQDARSGAFRFERWGAASVRVSTDGVAHESVRDNDDILVSVSVASDTRAPRRIELEVFWPHTPLSARLSVPFPGKGARVFDGEGREVTSGALLAVQKLVGSRMSVLGGQRNESITLELQARPGGASRVHRLRPPAEALQLELRLQDYAEEIHQLLSMDDSPDARVRVTLRIGGCPHFSLDIARYAARLSRTEGDVLLRAEAEIGMAPEALRDLPVHAMCLERPGDEAVKLEPIDDASGDMGCGWAFSRCIRQSGSWLIYPAADTRLPFRPTLWQVEGDPMAQSPLALAIMLPHPAARETALDEVIEAMAADFLHESWSEVEQFAGQIGHLPLATLDLWRRFARWPKAMAALAFRLGSLPAGFVDRFAHELPFAWETVGFSAWRDAIACLLQQCRTSFGEAGGESVFRHHLKSRIEGITARYAVLQYLLGIASSDHDAEARDQVRLLRYVGSVTDGKLDGDDDSLVMRLRRTHAEGEWPDGANGILSHAQSRPELAPFLCPGRYGFADGAINMPLLLAAEAATDRTDHWFGDASAIHVLRTHRAFDPEWFDEAYNHTIACCLATGALKV